MCNNNTLCKWCAFHYIAMVMFICFIGGQEELLCSHEALHLAVLNPTAFAEGAGNIVNHNECLHFVHTVMHVRSAIVFL